MAFYRLSFACLIAIFLSTLLRVGDVALARQVDASREGLFSAIRRGAVAEADRWLVSGASPDSVDTEGTPALMAATLFAGADMVKLLLDRKADPNRTDAAGATALMWAVPDVEKVRLLLARGANVNAQSGSGRTALLVAAAYPRTVSVLRLLVEDGADVRARDRADTTALALAARSGDIDVVRFLVERGLDPKMLSPVAFRAALARRDRATTDFLLSNGPGPAADTVITSAAWQPPELVDQWIARGADVNARNASQYGRTALLTAVTSEAAGADTVRLLLDRGSDPNVRSTEGEAPLDWAIYKGDRAKIQLLEQHGASRGNGPRRDEIPPPAKGGVADPRLSLNRSVARILDVAPLFRQRTGCISCHHNALPAMAAATAGQKGIEVDRVRARANLDDIFTFFKTNAPRVMLGDPAVGGEALTAGYALMALSAARHAADQVTATITHWLIARQMSDGSWLGNGVSRPPSEYSTISHTAIAAGGLVAYPLPGRSVEIRERLRRAQEWLVGAQPASAEERAMRLMGLVWTAAPQPRIEEALEAIRRSQETGGGWSQFGRTEADAYATGLSLYALHVAGMPVGDQTYRRGVAFLLGTQYQDGTWLVRTHSFPLQQYFESGFPFGRHQWISTAGTSWAALAVAQTLPDAVKSAAAP